MTNCPQCETESVVFGSFGGGFTLPTLVASCLKCGLYWLINERDGMVVKRLPVIKDFRKKHRKKILKRQEIEPSSKQE